MRGWIVWSAVVAGCAPGGAVVEGAPEEAERLPAGVTCDVRVPADAPTVQAGIDAAADGDTVCVGRGVWRENVVITGRAVTVVGHGPRASILDGGGLDSTVVVDDADVTLQGLTLRNGAAAYGGGLEVESMNGNSLVHLADLVIRDNVASAGGGIQVTHGTVYADRVVIRDNSATWGGGIQYGEGGFVGERVLIARNHADEDGGGISGSRGGATLTNSRVIGNDARRGGGMRVGTLSTTFRSTVFAANAAIEDGGGALVDGYDGPTFENVVFHGNTADRGGAVFVSSWGNYATFVNAVLSSNRATEGGGVFLDELTTASFAYTDLWDNGADVSDGSDPVGADGNLGVDPAFVDTTGANPLRWDFHLQAGSPLVDAGDPAILDADGSRSDLGAYGGPTAP